MEQVKFYSSKSNAKRAAVKANIDMETAVLNTNEAGHFAYTAPVVEEVAPVAPVVEVAAPAAPVADTNAQWYIDRCGHSHCPHCEIGLDNGLMDFNSMVETAGSYKAAFALQQHEWSCMGCGGEWGPEMTAPGATGTGIKIEKDREERNGVKRPSIGGVCRAIWDACDTFSAAQGRAPASKEVKLMAETYGWNANNASIEYYQWRKFMGIRGRQAAAPVAPAVETPAE